MESIEVGLEGVECNEMGWDEVGWIGSVCSTVGLRRADRTQYKFSFVFHKCYAIARFIPCLEKYSQSEARITVAYSAVCNG